MSSGRSLGGQRQGAPSLVTSAYGPSGAFCAGGEDQEMWRPRRPDPDTLSYLCSLPLDLKAAKAEVDEYRKWREGKKEMPKDAHKEFEPENDEGGEEDKIQMIHAARSAVEEIQNELASLAGDERGSVQIELLARIVSLEWAPSPVSMRRLLRAMLGYLLHLSCHRYGSHVVQTILSASCFRDNALTGNTPDILMNDDREYEDEDDATVLPSMETLVLNAADELLPHAPELARHVCGSHVLRALICTLADAHVVKPGFGGDSGNIKAGVLDTPNLLRGKKKKKKKGKKNPSPNDGEDSLDRQYHRVCIRNRRPSSSFRDALSMVVETLVGGGRESINDSVEPESLSLACHPSAGPLLVLLLRVLTALSTNNHGTNKKNDPSSVSDTDSHLPAPDFRLGTFPHEPVFVPGSDAERLVKNVLAWKNGESGNESDGDGVVGNCSGPSSSNELYILAGDTYGSRFFESVLILAHDDLHRQICERAGILSSNASILSEYVADDVSNYIIQTACRTMRTRDQVEAMIRGMKPLLRGGKLLERGRRGVFFRLVEMSAKWRIGQETVLKAMKAGFASLDSRSNGVDTGSAVDGLGDEGCGEGKTFCRGQKKDRSDKFTVALCVRNLLSLKISEDHDGGRITVDANGARAVHYLLRFVPRLCTEVLQGIFGSTDGGEGRGSFDHADGDTIVLIAKDGLASKCIVDGILDGPTDIEPFTSAVKALLACLRGRFVPLAVDRIGHHTVTKLFRALPGVNDKVVLVEELSRGKGRLGGNAIGRGVMEICHVQKYLDGEQSWKKTAIKHVERQKWMSDITRGDTVENGEQVKKRKRKRSGGVAKGNVALTSGEDLSSGDHGSGKTNDNCREISVVESIMNVISSTAHPKKPGNVVAEDGGIECTNKRKKRKKKRKKNEEAQ